MLHKCEDIFLAMAGLSCRACWGKFGAASGMRETGAGSEPGIDTKQAFLRIRGLTKRFGAFTALNRVDLDIGTGELVCFLGPSGCGKTTLLRAIAGLDRQDEGTIHMDGRDVSMQPPAARDFGIVFQSYALFPNLSVNANVGYGLVNRGHAKTFITARVAELLALVGLPEQGLKYPAQLSGGQQQRVALARALAMSPRLLLLDEPLSALDARVRVRLRGEIKALQRRLGVTTIMVTHDQEEALSMADRIVVMNQGVIEQTGTPRDIYCNPSSAFAADFVGAMNFFDAAIMSTGRASVGGITLHCRAAQASGLVRLALRPEEIQLTGVSPDSPNALFGKVEAVEFLGSIARIRFTLDALPGVSIVAEAPAAVVTTLQLAPETKHMLALPAECLRAFPAVTAA